MRFKFFFDELELHAGGIDDSWQGPRAAEIVAGLLQHPTIGAGSGRRSPAPKRHCNIRLGTARTKRLEPVPL